MIKLLQLDLETVNYHVCWVSSDSNLNHFRIYTKIFSHFEERTLRGNIIFPRCRITLGTQPSHDRECGSGVDDLTLKARHKLCNKKCIWIFRNVKHLWTKNRRTQRLLHLIVTNKMYRVSYRSCAISVFWIPLLEIFFNVLLHRVV